MAFLQETIFGNTIQQWIVFAGIVVLGTAVLVLASGWIARSFRALDRKIPGDYAGWLAHTMERTKKFLMLVIALYAGTRYLTLPPSSANLFLYAAIIAGGLQVGIWASYLISQMVVRSVNRARGDTEATSAATVINVLSRVLVWTFVLLVVLDNLGFDITALIAGLGVGGIAIAMASQQVLSELFASLSILLDKPFQVGEFIIVGDMLGVVENIGLKTTRIRSLSGELLIFSNADLLSSRIRNYKTMQERRVVFTIGVEYNTPYQKLTKIPEIIRNAVETTEATRFDRCHFASYGDFSLNFETVYYVLSGDYNQYMDIQQKINLQIYEAFEQENIVFAFPTRTIHLKQAEEAGS